MLIGRYRRHAPGGNRSQQGRWTQLILPVSRCDTNASVCVTSNLFRARAPEFVQSLTLVLILAAFGKKRRYAQQSVFICLVVRHR
jgi:hypothetical protein